MAGIVNLSQNSLLALLWNLWAYFIGLEVDKTIGLWLLLFSPETYVVQFLL